MKNKRSPGFRKLKTTKQAGAKLDDGRPKSAPKPPRRILVPVDFSSLSARTVEYARSFARQFNAQVSIIHVVEAFPIDYMLGIESSKIVYHHLIVESRVRVQQIAKQFAGIGRAADSWVAFGIPYKEIVKGARECDADLILLATHGYTGLKHIQMGSTAERVVRHAPCPVLVFRANANARTPEVQSARTTKTRAEGARFNVQRILVPVDFSARSAKALQYALPIARRFRAKIVLLHVVEVPNYDYGAFDYRLRMLPERESATRKELATLADSVSKWRRVTTTMETGHPGKLIIKTADKRRIDLIIMSTHGRTGFKRALLGSTTEFVVRHADCPVLTVRVQQQGVTETSSRKTQVRPKSARGLAVQDQNGM